VHFGDINFYVIDISVEDKSIDVLHKSECSYFGQHSGFEPVKSFTVTISNSELIA